MLGVVQLAPAAPAAPRAASIQSFPALPARPGWTWMADPNKVVLVAGAPGQEARPCVQLHKALHLAGMGAAGQDASGRAQVAEQEALGRVRVGALDHAVTAHGITYDRGSPANTGTTYYQDVLCRRPGQSPVDPTEHRHPLPVWEAIDTGGRRHFDHAAHLAFRLAVTQRLYPQGLPEKLVREAVSEVVDVLARGGNAGRDLGDQIRLVPWSLLTEVQAQRLAKAGLTSTGQTLVGAGGAPAPAATAPDVALLLAQVEALRAELRAAQAGAERDSAAAMATGLAEEVAARDAAEQARREAKAEAERRRRAARGDASAQQPPADQTTANGEQL